MSLGTLKTSATSTRHCVCFYCTLGFCLSWKRVYGAVMLLILAVVSLFKQPYTLRNCNYVRLKTFEFSQPIHVAYHVCILWKISLKKILLFFSFLYIASQRHGRRRS